MDTAALDAVPELYYRTLDAIDHLAALIAAGAPEAEVTFAAAELADFRAAFERAAGIIAGVAGLGAAIREEGIREGRRQRDAEIAAGQHSAQARRLLQLVASG